MIKPNELRIGNILKSVHTGECIKVDWLVIKHVMDGNKQSPPYDMSSVYEPIPLTEEILLKCGFTPCSIMDNHFNIPGMCIWKCNDMFMCNKNGVHVKHLHQLQNLYFALTGEELEVKL